MRGVLSGLVIDTVLFPRPGGHRPLPSHAGFAPDHSLLAAMPRIADDSVAVEVRHFPVAELDAGSPRPPGLGDGSDTPDGPGVLQILGPGEPCA